MKKEEVQWYREMSGSASRGREVQGLMVDLRARPASQKGWQRARGVWDTLSGLGRVKKRGNVLCQ